MRYQYNFSLIERLRVAGSTSNSAAALIGITVSSAVGGILIAGLAAFYAFWRRRNRKRPNKAFPAKIFEVFEHPVGDAVDISWVNTQLKNQVYDFTSVIQSTNVRADHIDALNFQPASASEATRTNFPYNYAATYYNSP